MPYMAYRFNDVKGITNKPCATRVIMDSPMMPRSAPMSQGPGIVFCHHIPDLVHLERGPDAT